jgi:hypothetical protein
MKYFLSIVFIFLFSFCAYSQNCTYSLSSNNIQVGNDTLGIATVQLTTDTNCAWTAVSNDDWITVTSGTSGTGNVTIQIAINSTNFSNTTFSRSGTVLIAGQTVNVIQTYDCRPLPFSYEGNQVFSQAPATGGTFSLLTPLPGCRYVVNYATPSLGSINIDTGTITYAPNTGAAKTGFAEIRYTTYQGFTSGINVFMSQQSACDYNLAFESQNFSASGGVSSFTKKYSHGNGCSNFGTSISNVPWITITNDSSIVTQYAVAPNSETPRTGTITVTTPEGILTHTITQSNVPCSYAIKPIFQIFSASNDIRTFKVTTQAGCSWQARTNSTFISVDSQVYTGSRNVDISVLLNPGPERTGTVSIGDQTITLSQQSGCTFTPSATSANFVAAKTNSTFTISAYPDCVWHALSQNDWITVNLGANWSGPGTVAYSVAANTSNAPRTGTITVGGNTFTITQAGAAKSRKRTRFF